MPFVGAPHLWHNETVSDAMRELSMKTNPAIAALRSALEISPDNLPLRRHLAATLAENGQLTEAQAELQEALRKSPDDAESLLQLGRVLLCRDRAEEAAARLSQCLRMDDESATAHFEMARALHALGAHDRAGFHYRHAVELDINLRDRVLEDELKAAPELLSVVEDEESATETPSEDSAIISGLGIPVEKPQVSFSDIGGMEELKEQIRVDIIYPFEKPEIYAAYGKKVGGGILLYGPPGCGKTYMARATAGECGARFIAVGIEDVLHMYMGESERRLHAIFEAARAAKPTIVFFDELEALAGKRADMDSSPHGRALVNQFLAELDGVQSDNSNILVMGATNSPWTVDPAFRRPGRFDKVLFVPPPDLAARRAILQLHCRNKPLEEINFDQLAQQTRRFSGADIAALCESATEIALRETLKTGQLRQLRTDDFLKALKTVRATTDEWLSTAKNYVTYSNQSGLYDAVAQYLKKGGE
jgi:SpoVK/Ycf46/Vps4 family AAA+-type ATPase